MRMLPLIGGLLILLGIASLLVPIPRRQRHGISVGGVSLGVETTEREKVHPALSAVMIGSGALLMFAGRKRAR